MKVGATFIIAALCLSAPLQGATNPRAVRVGANVVPFFVHSIEGLPQSVAITAADVEAGYVDISGMRVVIRTNDAGYMITFQLASNAFDGVEVGGLNERVAFGAGGAFVTRRLERIAPVVHDLAFRMHLSAGTVPGVYVSPLRIGVYRLST